MGADQNKDAEGKVAAPQAGANGAADDEDEDDEDEKEPELTLEQALARLKKAEAQKAKANNEAMKLRLEKAQAAAAKTDGKADDKKDAAAESLAKLERELKARDAAEQLIAAGYNGSVKGARKLVKSFDSLDASDLDDQISEFKEDNPALFKRRKRVETPAGVARGSGSNPDADKGTGGNLSDASALMLKVARG